MRGFITERDFASAECEFPGICRLYQMLVKKPATFLELVWQWERQDRREDQQVQAASMAAAR
jgi:hypothetical protein